METKSSIQHDLRREFHNMLGILKVIKNESVIKDEELKDMIGLCLGRENDITAKLDELTDYLEKMSE